MKGLIFLFFILSAFLIGTTQFVYAGKSWEYKDWSVSSYADFVKYVAHGDTVDGHHFGFIKNRDNCDRNILWISVSTQAHGVKSLEGVKATIQVKFDETSFQAEVDVLAVSESMHSLTTIAFTNFVAGKKFIDFLEKGQKVEITILAPEQLLNKLDIKTDTFSLKGFTATMLKAKEFCESKTEPSIDGTSPPPDISTKAEQGDTEAQILLAMMYLEGKGVPIDLYQATQWFKKAAEQGNAEAQTLLGVMYMEGKGVPIDLYEAAKWVKKAADQGDAEAQTLLGVMCLSAETGRDTTEPSVMLKNALELFEKSAEQGNDSGQYHLGLMYLSGKGVPQDKIKAYEWYMKSARQGNTKAQDALDILCKESSWACK